MVNSEELSGTAKCVVIKESCYKRGV